MGNKKEVRGRRVLVALALGALMVLGAACGEDEPVDDGNGSGQTETQGSDDDYKGGAGDKDKDKKGSKSKDDEPAPSSVTGTIVSLEQDGDAVTSFVIEDAQTGDEMEVMIDPEIDYDYDLAHLAEHSDESHPVIVELEERGDDLYATSITDA